MDTSELGKLKEALIAIDKLADPRNWYEEKPEDGGPWVWAWKGKGRDTPLEIAMKAQREVRSVERKY